MAHCVTLDRISWSVPYVCKVFRLVSRCTENLHLPQVCQVTTLVVSQPLSETTCLTANAPPTPELLQ